MPSREPEGSGASFWSVNQVALHLGLPTDSIYRLIERRELPHIRIGRRVLVHRQELAAWLAERRVPPETCDPVIRSTP